MGAGDKSIEEAAKTARHYLDPVLQTPLAEAGLLLRDKISYWRFKNQVNTAIKAKEFLEKKGVDPRMIEQKVSPELVVPLLEASGETSDDTLSDMFANLLAGAIDPERAGKVHPSFGKVLNQLSPLDAKILDSLNREVVNVEAKIQAGGSIPENYNQNVAAHRQLGYEEETLSQRLEVEAAVVRISFENIRRLGLGDEGHDALSRINRIRRICLTDYGRMFMEQCTVERNGDRPS